MEAGNPFQMDPVTKLKELRDAVGRGEIDEVKNIVKWFEQDVDRIRTLLPAAYVEARTCPTQDDLVIAACSHNQKHVLDYLLSQTDILYYLTDSTQNNTEVGGGGGGGGGGLERTEAVRHALRLEDFEMVVKLYDYWIGDLYWKGHQKDNFKMLRKILNGANSPKNLLGWVCSIFKKILIRCRFMTINQQLIIDFESIIKVNDFQQKLYNTLPKPLSHYAVAEDTAAEGTNGKDTVETARVILKLLNIYDEYSVIDKVRIKDVTKEKQIKSYFEDTDSIYFKALADIKYEFYFRKVDFNMALLLLEKLYIIRNYLKKRFNTNQLETASKTYREIEYAIYHLIYRTSEDWRLYLPADRQLTEETHHIGIYNGAMGRLKTTYDIHKLYNSPVLYLEREHYKTCLRNLKDILNEYCIKSDPVIDGEQTNTNKKILRDENNPKPTKKVIGVQNKTPKKKMLDENYLKPMMEVSDHYSLNKIITYIEALEQTTDTDIIMIERVLQVIGEMVKAEGTGGESSHLSKETKTYLQIAISTDTIKHLQGIREFLSHAHKGQLSIRIDIEDNQADMLLNVKEELVEIKEKIVPIRDLCKLVLDNLLLQKGLDLLKERIEKLPDDAKQRVKEIESGVKEHGVDFVSDSEDTAVEKTVAEYTTAEDTAVEDTAAGKTAAEDTAVEKTVAEYTTAEDTAVEKTVAEYTTVEDTAVEKIFAEYTTAEDTAVEDTAAGRTTGEDTAAEKTAAEDTATEDIAAEGTAAEDTAAEDITAEVTAAEDTAAEYTAAEDTAAEDTAAEDTAAEDTAAEDTAAETCAEDTAAEDTAAEDTAAEDTAAEDTAAEDTRFWQSGNGDTAAEDTTAHWKSVVVLAELVNQEPSTYPPSTDKINIILNKVQGVCPGNNQSTNNTFTGIKNLYNEIKEKSRTCQTNRQELTTCLINRIKRLRATLGYPKQIPLRELVQLYKLDPKFRCELETLLGDIENIIKLIKNKPISKKEGKLLEGIVLRNVLYHGNPFLEVIGDLIDSQDLPRELLSKAISYANDQEAVEALEALFQHNVDFDTINDGTLANMNDAQKGY
ncbi:hypothetical protein SFRURICE_003593 [Spodoptera frugiperda]|nr:hypothetical protein SFRURICE_003593 [Spodoptera frugiperda]